MDKSSKIVLVNPPMDFAVAFGKAQDIADYTVMLPVGIAYIAAVLADNGVAVEVLDGYAEKLSIAQMARRVREAGAAIVGISCVTPVAPTVHALAAELKSADPAVKIVLGGPHPSSLPEETLADANIDLVVRGEGESTMLELARSGFAPEELAPIAGISWRRDGRVVHNPDRAFLEDLDSLPFPAHRLLPMRRYTAPPQWSLASPAYQVCASRGCPCRCSFCAVGMGRRTRLRSAGNICDEIELLIRDYGCRQVVFVDSIFPVNISHATSVCDEMIRRGLHRKVVWFTSTRVNVVNLEMLKKMRRAGCRLMTYGVESGNQRILDRAGKGITLDQIRKAVAMAKEAGIDILACYILGLPGETCATGQETIAFATELDTLYAQFNLLVPYPATEIYEEAVKLGQIRSQDWSRYISITSMTDIDPPFIPEGMTQEQLLAIQKQAYRRFYFRPKSILRHLLRTLTNWDPQKYYRLAKVLLQTVRGGA